MKKIDVVVHAEKDLIQFLCVSPTWEYAKVCFSGVVPELRKTFRFKPATFLIAGIVFLLVATIQVQASGVPSSPSEVEVRTGDRRVFVRSRKDDGTLSESYAYTMKGINWSPASRGIWPDSNPVGFKQEYFTGIRRIFR